MSKTNKELRELISTLTTGEIKRLYSIIGGMLSKRTISKEQQEKMQAGRKMGE